MLVQLVGPPAGHLGRVARHQSARSSRCCALSATSNAAFMCTGSPSALLVASDDTCTWLPASHSPQEVLAQRANGAYTTASVMNAFNVVDWRLHLQRLVRNMRCLHDERPPSFQPVIGWLSKQDRSPEDIVAEMVQPRVALALTQLAEQQQQQQLPSTTQAHADQLMLTIVLEDDHTSSCNTNTAPLMVTVFCKPFPRPSPSTPVNVLVHGAPRRWAHAKHCQWVLDRRALEAAKPPGTAEVLLCSEEGAVVEGLISNFFVIAGDTEAAQPSAASSTEPAFPHSSSHNLQGLTLVTNGPHEPALQGITQARVLQAATLIGLPVKLASPQLDKRHQWQEAVISNCLKGIQPVSKVTKLHTEGAEDGWELHLPHAYGLATQQLQAALAEVQELTDARSWLSQHSTPQYSTAQA